MRNASDIAKVYAAAGLEGNERRAERLVRDQEAFQTALGRPKGRPAGERNRSKAERSPTKTTRGSGRAGKGALA